MCVIKILGQAPNKGHSRSIRTPWTVTRIRPTITYLPKMPNDPAVTFVIDLWPDPPSSRCVRWQRTCARDLLPLHGDPEMCPERVRPGGPTSPLAPIFFENHSILQHIHYSEMWTCNNFRNDFAAFRHGITAADDLRWYTRRISLEVLTHFLSSVFLSASSTGPQSRGVLTHFLSFDFEHRTVTGPPDRELISQPNIDLTTLLTRH